MRSQRKLAALLMSLSMVVTMPYTAFATEPTVTDSNPVSASSAERQGDVVQGVAVTENTLFQDSTPDAHYQATFTLDTSDFAKEVAKVEVGGNFQFYTEDQLDDYLANEDTIEPGTSYGEFTLSGYRATEYKAGMFTTGVAMDLAATGQANYLYELSEIKENIWQTSLPLPGGQYYYDYFITYADGSKETIKDPANLPIANGDSDANHSLFYVGNSEDCVAGEEYVFPRTDGKTGTVNYVTYTAVDGSTQPLGIYLPYGYDETKTYKTLYLSHGGGGNEVEWYEIGSAKNIFDNLIAEGELEPTIIVTMDNLYFNFESGDSVKNITECIIPYMEANYAVDTSREGRAIAGLSSGGSVSVDAMLNANDTFDYYGVFSPSRTMNFVEESLTDEMKADLKDAESYYVSCGIFDSYLRRNVNEQVYEELQAIDANVAFTWKNGSHDWAVWRAQLSDFAKNYLWETGDPEPPVTTTLGVQVESNTLFQDSTPDAHYQATFTLDTSGFAKEVAKVEVGGNFQFYTEDQLDDYLANEDTIEPGKSYEEFTLSGYRATEYKAGMFTTGVAMDLAATGQANYLYELSEIEENIWQTSLPLPGGQYYYDYFITYADGTTETIKDPANLPIANGDSDANHSLFYVGNSEDCVAGEEYVFPRTDGKTGTVNYVTYTAVDGSTQPLGIYLPYGYDETKTYKTLYLSHGGGGNEVEWYEIGSAKNIFDNLIAEGELEPTIIVTMDNLYFNFESGDSVKNITECIIPYMEANYAVDTSREGRAIAGLSSGGSVSVDAMLNANDTFDYYGVFSPSRTMNFVEESLTDEMKADLKDAESYYVSCGIFDSYLRRNVNEQVYEELQAIDANVAFTWKNGSHDWAVWRAQLSDFAKNYLWETDAPTGDQTPVQTGDPVQALPLVLGMVISVSALGFVVYRRKKENA